MDSFHPVLRGLVNDAFDKRGTDEFAGACALIVEEWERWPLTEVLVEMRKARAMQAKADADRLALERLLRESYVPEAAA